MNAPDVPAPGPSEPPHVVPGAVVRLTVREVDGRGRGLASLGRRPVRIPNALAGETLDLCLVHVGRHVAEARIEAVVTSSPDRVPDACAVGATCPGCGLRTTAGPARLAFKSDRVRSALARVGLGGVAVDATVAAPAEDGWRHKAYLTARRTRRGIQLGLFAAGTHRLVRVEGCLAHAPHVEATLAGVRRALAEVDPSVYDERTRRGWLRAVAVRGSSVGDRRTLVTLVATARAPDVPVTPDPATALAQAILRHDPAVAGAGLNVHPAAGNAPFGETFLHLAGADHLTEGSGGHALRVGAGAFFQVNPAVGAAILDRVTAQAATLPPGLALDLYGGVGATSVRLAAAGRSVVLVEARGPAASDAVGNLAPFPSASVVAARVEDAGGSLPWAESRLVVVNPPRSGLLPAVVEGLRHATAATLCYVSCDPDSLARDLARLTAAGRRVLSVTPFDLMPQTPHVETLAVLSPSAP